jgi:hypothetical protein
MSVAISYLDEKRRRVLTKQPQSLLMTYTAAT